jgi:thiol-disulfide isomerase/thioredoxin
MHNLAEGQGPSRADHARRRAVLATLLSAGAGAAGLAGCTRRTQVPAVGFTLLDGSPGSTVALRGQVVLVNFWATGCASCVQKMPTLAQLQADHAPRGFTVLAVAVRWDAPANVAHFAESRRLPFPVAIDNTGAIAQSFGGVSATPTSFLVDRRGAVAHRHDGRFDVARLRRRLERLLEEV